MHKRTILPLIFLLLFANLLFGQGGKKGDFWLGSFAGPNFSNLRGSLNRSEEVKQAIGPVGYEANLLADIRYGISKGVKLEYFLKDDFSLVTSLGYENKGLDMNAKGNERGTYTNENTGELSLTQKRETFNRKVRNDYLVLPLLLRKYCFKKRNFFLEAGGYVAHLIKSEVDMYDEVFLAQSTSFPTSGSAQLEDVGNENFASSYIFESKGVNGKNHTQKLDYGLSLGAGYAKSFSRRLRCEAKLLCNYGLRKIDSKFDNKVVQYPFTTGMDATFEDYYGLNSHAKNISLSYCLGVSILLNK